MFMEDQCCGNCGKPADNEFTMDFTDVEPGAYLYWCSSCGPREQKMKAILEASLQNDPSFAQKLEAAIDRALLEAN